MKRIIIFVCQKTIDWCLKLPVLDDEDRSQHKELVYLWKKLEAMKS